MQRLKVLLVIILCFSNYVISQTSSQVKFSGLMFGDYFYNAAAHDGSLRDLNGVQLRRIYFTADYNISNDFSSRFRLESDQTSNSLTNGGKLGVMVKDAWLKWQNIFSGSDLYFGVSPTPAFEISENAWGHRFLEKTIMDLNGIVSSRDLGVDLRGNLSGDGSIKYWVKLGNNSSNGPETNKYKRFYAMVEFHPSTEFQITVYGDYAGAPQVFDPADGVRKSNNSLVGALFLNYMSGSELSFGLETYIKDTQNNYTATPVSTLQNQTNVGFSLWAWGRIAPAVKLVGRVDFMDPNTNADMDSKGLILLGVDLNPVNNVTITPNIELFTYQANPVNGGDKSDVIPRITFYWVF